MLGLAIAALTACATEPSTCEVAAAKLSGCGPEQTQSFIAACEETGGAADPALLADDSAAACALPADGKADAQPALVGMCVAAMYGVKWTVTALSPAALPLSAATKAALRPMFGALVDKVRISLGAQLPPRIVIAGHRLSVEPAAMTFGTSIFVLEEVAESMTPDRLLLTTVHELTHAQQSERAGGYYGFAVNYCRDLIAVNFDYNKNGLETAAYAVQSEAEQNLHDECGQVVCP